MGNCGSCGRSFSVSSSGSSTCSCGAATCGSSPCEEDHTHTIIKKYFSFTLRTAASFTWPEVGESATIQVDSVDRLAIGAVLYLDGAGYLHVTSFDCNTQRVVAQNLGETCNIYTGGETVPACAEFSVGIPFCGNGSGGIPGIPYLAADFISPADGDCALASVTIIGSIAPEDTVTIDGYEYRVSGIVDSTTLTLCNDGEGAPEGQVIEWDPNNDGVPDVPIFISQVASPCVRDPVVTGRLLVCTGDGIVQPLEGSATGQSLIWDNDAELWILDGNQAVGGSTVAAIEDVEVLGAPATSITVQTGTINITNPSATRSMLVHLVYTLGIGEVFFAPSVADGLMSFQQFLAINTDLAGFVDYNNQYYTLYSPDVLLSGDRQTIGNSSGATVSEVVTVAPGDSVSKIVRSTITLVAKNDGALVANIRGLAARISYLGTLV